MGKSQKRILSNVLSEEQSASSSDEYTANPPKKKQCIELESQPLIITIESSKPIPEPTSSMNPKEYLKNLAAAVVAGKTIQATPATSLDGFFPVATEEQHSGYTMDVVSAARNNDVHKLRSLRDNEGATMDCFNRFGESLLHMACRRGYKEMTEFLMADPTVEVRVVDDCGRTPMHDTCWSPTPQLDIARWILEREPSLLFVADKRGFTPLDYVRPEHWSIWNSFLYDNRTCLQNLGSNDVYSKFC